MFFVLYFFSFHCAIFHFSFLEKYLRSKQIYDDTVHAVSGKLQIAKKEKKLHLNCNKKNVINVIEGPLCW